MKDIFKKKVIIIILNWNGKEDTVECLESLKHVNYPNYEILLVDNGSTDGSTEYLREQYPNMEIIENEKNLGFAEGNNVGIRRAIAKGADNVLLLNNDTVVDPEFLIELVIAAENDVKNGIVGPKIYYYNNRKIIASAGGEIGFFGNTYQIGEGEYDAGQYNMGKKVTWLTGAAILIRKELILDIGGLDSNFFIFEEDLDLCLRANKNNYVCFYEPKSKVYHKGEVSTSKISGYFSLRNGLIVARRHYNLRKLSLFLIRYFSYIFPRSFCYNLLTGKLHKNKDLIKATLDGLSEI